MKSVDVCGICRDDGATKRLLRKLLSPVDFNSSYSTMLPGIFHCWIEEQAKLFVESFVTVHSSGVIGEFISAIEPKFEPSNPKVEHSNPAEKQQTSNSAEVVSNGLQGLTFGGVQIGVKIKQQKKRMKPSLLNDKPVNNSILGNINSQTIEAQDIRKELKSVIAPMSISKSPITIQTPTTEHVNGIPATVTEITEKAPTCTGSACSLCQAKEDVSAVLRLAAIYSALVKYQHISLTKAISLIQLLTCMDPHKCNDGFIQVCVLDSVPGRRPSPSPPAGALLINASCMRAFVRTLLDQCTPIITNIGTVIGGEVMESAVVRSWAPELAVKMKDILGTNSSVGAPCGLDAQSRSSNFKLPETFLKPFREDIDSKNEYKTQVGVLCLFCAQCCVFQ